MAASEPSSSDSTLDSRFSMNVSVLRFTWALADLVLQPQFIRHRLEGIGIVADQQLGIRLLQQWVLAIP